MGCKCLRWHCRLTAGSGEHPGRSGTKRRDLRKSLCSKFESDCRLLVSQSPCIGNVTATVWPLSKGRAAIRTSGPVALGGVPNTEHSATRNSPQQNRQTTRSPFRNNARPSRTPSLITPPDGRSARQRSQRSHYPGMRS